MCSSDLEIMKRLQFAAEAAFRLDEEMSLIRNEIHEAQQYFTEYKELTKPNVESDEEKGDQSS